jgi:hypothetical protein
MSESFDPEDIEEIEQRFNAVIQDSEEGYVMELMFSRADGKDMIKTWVKAMMGDPAAMTDCFVNYSMIMEEVKNALVEDDR